MRFKRRTLTIICIQAADKTGSRKKGSGTARFVNHSAPPSSMPGTGMFAMPRVSLKAPKPIMAVPSGPKNELRSLIPATARSFFNSRWYPIASVVFLFLNASFIFSLMGSVTGAMAFILAAESADCA